MAKTTIFQLVTCAGFSLTTRLGCQPDPGLVRGLHRQYRHRPRARHRTQPRRRGTFRYPTPDDLSYFMILRDTTTFEHATPAYRETIFDLRARPTAAPNHRRRPAHLRHRHRSVPLKLPEPACSSRSAQQVRVMPTGITRGHFPIDDAAVKLL